MDPRARWHRSCNAKTKSAVLGGCVWESAAQKREANLLGQPLFARFRESLHIASGLLVVQISLDFACGSFLECLVLDIDLCNS